MTEKLIRIATLPWYADILWALIVAGAAWLPIYFIHRSVDKRSKPAPTDAARAEKP